MAQEMDQLTLDSIAAQKAGMSYGKWMALHYKPVVVPVVVVEPEPEEVPAVIPVEGRCAHCGKKITGGHGNRKYCDETCYYEHAKVRQRAYYRKKTERMMANGKI